MMPGDELVNATDDFLLSEIGKGNKAAFDQVYNKYWKKIFNAAYKRLENADQAKDVAQDVFVQLWTREKNTPIENLNAYLHIAARNAVFRLLEREGRYAFFPGETAELEKLKAPHSQADGDMLFKEFLQTFHALTASLPEQQRLIFHLRFQEGRSSQEIADTLQVSVKTVRNQMGRALARIKQSLLPVFLLLLRFFISF